MPTLVTTAGSASANSFATAAQFETYCDGRSNAAAAFAAADDDAIARALMDATLELDLLTYIGRRVDTTQALSWPRLNAINPDHPYLDWFTNTEIPTRLVKATCEYALQFLKGGDTDIAGEDTSRNIIEESVDVISTKYSDPYQRPKGVRRYPRVWSLVVPLTCSFSPNVVPVVHG